MLIDDIKETVRYNPDTGIFTYIKTNKEIHNRNKLGYVRVSVKGKRYLAHRLAIIYTYGKIDDKMEVDHLNQIKHDNRICNLKVGTSRDNKMNKALQSNNSTGINGVSYSNKYKRYEVSVKTDNRKIFLGHFDNLEEARACRIGANRVLEFSEIHGL